MSKGGSGSFKPTRTAYVFARFASGEGDAGGVLMDGGPVTVRLHGSNPGTTVDQTLTLAPGHDGGGGTYYWGSFLPSNSTQSPIVLSVSVDASDAFPGSRHATPPAIGWTTIAGKFLHDVFAALDLPRPSENPADALAHDVRTGFAGLAKLLVSRATASTLKAILGREVTADLAAACLSTAKASRALGLTKEAAQLYESAVASYQNSGEVAAARTTLLELAGFYEATGSPKKAVEARGRLGKLPTPVIVRR